MAKQEEGVQLKGVHLSRARRHAMVAQDELLSLASIALSSVSSKLTADDIKEIRITPNNMKAIFVENGKCVAVYEDPPGICRPCKHE
jgi:hypothetical protein